RAGLCRSSADLGVLEQLTQLQSAGVHLALLLLGGGVAAFLAQVRLFARGLDLLGDLDLVRTLEIVKLGLQPVIRFLGEPGDVVTGLGHDAPRGVGWLSLGTAGSVQSGPRRNYEASKVRRHFPRRSGPGPG